MVSRGKIIKEERMKEIVRRWRIKANSFTAPFFSDPSEEIVEAKTSKEALEKFVESYGHPCGLYSAAVYGRNGIDVEYQYLCGFELEKEKRTAGLGVCILRHDMDDGGEFIEVNDKKYYVKNPKEGKIRKYRSEGKGGGGV